MGRKKTILITGAGGNLGSAILPILIQKEFDILAITSPRKQVGVAGIREFKADLSNENDVARLTLELQQGHHQIDAALFLAGSYEGGSLEHTDSAALQRMYSVNFETAFYLGKNVFDLMKSNDSGGSMVFIGSKPALEPASGRHAVAYALSKSLLMTFSEQLNAEGASNNIKSYVIAPGTIDTPENRRQMPDADFSTWNKPLDIAELFVEIIEGRKAGTTLIRLY